GFATYSLSAVTEQLGRDAGSDPDIYILKPHQPARDSVVIQRRYLEQLADTIQDACHVYARARYWQTVSGLSQERLAEVGLSVDTARQRLAIDIQTLAEIISDQEKKLKCGSEFLDSISVARLQTGD
ncbi:MAG TPA: hypothetical protein VEA37_06985, partial [Flavobacterium sp.]|nr:hypothetical protein [Flavobacterium sp.]